MTWVERFKEHLAAIVLVSMLIGAGFAAGKWAGEEETRNEFESVVCIKAETAFPEVCE
jgi:hypothetical protein